MTREDKLYSMKGVDLIKVADSLGVKVSCNKTRTALKEAKSDVINRILEAEETAAIMAAKAEIGIQPEPLNPEDVEIISDDSDISSDGTKYTDVMAEIIHGAEQRAKAVRSTSKKLPEQLIEDIRAYIDTMAEASGFTKTTKLDYNISSYRYKDLGAPIAIQVWWSSRRVEIHSKSKFDKYYSNTILANAIPVNHNLNRKWIIKDLDAETKYWIGDLIKAVEVANG